MSNDKKKLKTCPRCDSYEDEGHTHCFHCLECGYLQCVPEMLQDYWENKKCYKE